VNSLSNTKQASLTLGTTNEVYETWKKYCMFRDVCAR